MSLDVIKSIGDAEELARQARLAAQTKAKNMIAEAEKKGQAVVLDAVTRAEADVKRLLDEAENKAASSAAGLLSTTSEKQAEIRRLAECRLDDAAGLIVERIVNG
jgi:V/A-type H+-transporting ATPase subunit G/H